MPSNTAAWLPASQAPLEVKPAPYTAPQGNDIVVRNHAVAVNPIDWLLQMIGYFIFPWINPRSSSAQTLPARSSKSEKMSLGYRWVTVFSRMPWDRLKRAILRRKALSRRTPLFLLTWRRLFPMRCPTNTPPFFPGRGPSRFRRSDSGKARLASNQPWADC